MSVGFPVSKSAIDERAGNIALGLRRDLEQVIQMKEWLDTRSVQELQSFGYTEAEATLLKDSFTDLAALVNVARGAAPQPQANNFFWNAKNLIGVN